MDNQHRLIKTYRELNQEEIALMNECKVLEAQFLALHSKIQSIQHNKCISAELTSMESFDVERSLRIAKEQCQTAFMWLVRSVARPAEPAFESEDAQG